MNIYNPVHVEVPVERCRDGARLPVYAREGDAGMDICSAVDITILPGQTVLIPTGLKFAVPPGYEMQVRPRSGISLRTALRIPNSPGTIDSGYREEVGIIMTNTCLPANAATIDSIKDIMKNSGEFPICGLDAQPANETSADGPLAVEPPMGGPLAGEPPADGPLAGEPPADGPSVDGPCAYKIRVGDRIAQIIIKTAPVAHLIEVDDIRAYGSDRQGGFGSTGI